MSSTQHYRSISGKEKAQLLSQGCSAFDWDAVYVVDGFAPEYYRNVVFSGNVKLGIAGRKLMVDGIVRNCGIYDATIHNCTIGNDVFIRHVHNHIANFTIGDNVYIENVDSIVASPGATFGNGVNVTVLNETGGREVPIFDCLDAQTAYVLTFYRHDAELIDALSAIIDQYVESKISDYGIIADGVFISDSGRLRNVNIAQDASIIGVSSLSNGTVGARAKISDGVSASDFIISEDAVVDGGVSLKRVFVGQASKISCHFTARDVLFFANCNCENGEAVAVFAGPFTVSDHKSSLLIGGYYSFFNAGSGCNQSNHLYKLGPMHQGIMLRGCKTASDSYVMWPARIGAFSTVVGRHYSHPDTLLLPFSLITTVGDCTAVIPGVNVKSIGTLRDANKWPSRDKRSVNERRDCINFDVFSAYTVAQCLKGITVLKEQNFSDIVIPDDSIKKACDYYTYVCQRFIGDVIINAIGNVTVANDVIDRLIEESIPHDYEWVDLSGLVAPKSEVERICESIKNGSIDTIKGLQNEFKQLAENYNKFCLQWVCYILRYFYFGDSIGKEIMHYHREASVILLQAALDDAMKEYSGVAVVGYGIDGDATICNADFENVHGDNSAYSIIKQLASQIDALKK